MAYDLMTAYIDESGAVEANEPFMAGVWFTAYGPMWERVVTERRDALKYNYTMHFHKISNNKNDWQFRIVRRLFRDLRRIEGSWYARMLHVSPHSLSEWAHMSTQDKYDNLIANLVLRFAPHAHAKSMKIIISNRSRPITDNFLPDSISILLNEKSTLMRGPSFTVELDSPKNNNLLQIADLVTSGIRQVYYPSNNNNKCLLAGLLQPLIGSRIVIWDW